MKQQVLLAAAAVAAAAGLGFGVRYALRSDSGRPDESPAPETPPPNYPKGAPPLRVRPAQKWDFGTARPGQELKYQLKVTNPTEQPWALKGVLSTCACTVGELPSKAVRPGATAALAITYRAPLREGKAGGTVQVEFAEPGPILQLLIEGEVRSLLSAAPPSLVFDPPTPGARLKQTVRLRNDSDRRVALTRVDAPDWLRAEWQPAAGAGPRQEWEVVVRVDPGKLPSGGAAATLAVHTDSDEVGPAVIPVSLKAPLEATPDHLAFGAVKSGEVARKKVLLRAAPGLGELTEKDLEVTLHDLGPEVQAQVQKGEAGQFTLTVQYQPKRPRGLVEGELEVKTRKGAAVSVRVRVTGEAARPAPPGG